ncbi:hypothetical protein NDU88_003260 [Pleurodeles waltl]|uniref:Uncharacterized protein n=1 Tax=Pleurodeles waltl TaxID=8319 RepID=A0AAV7LL44_PLEWA|nr:hypothetical protein NDU88_003260 [Pleurodeles waltl]
MSPSNSQQPGRTVPRKRCPSRCEPAKHQHAARRRKAPTCRSQKKSTNMPLAEEQEQRANHRTLYEVRPTG